MAVKTFQVSTEYDRQAAEARKRRRMADLLAQQVIEPTQYGPGPTPAAAPLVQGLQAFIAARAGKKAEQAAESAKETGQREARQFLKAFTDEDKVIDQPMSDTPTAMPKVTAPQFEDGRITAPAQVEAMEMPQMAAPQVQLSRFGNLTREQRLALALEGALTSENPAIQRIAQMQYQTLQPQQSRLQVGAIDPAKFTPQSLAAAMQSGDVAQLQPVADVPPPRIGAPSPGDFTPASLDKFRETGRYEDLVSVPKPGPTVKVSTGGGMGKPPSGYRFTPDGNLEPIKGGPQDPNRERTMPASVLQTVNFEKDKGRRFANIATRADDFIAKIEQGKLPLNKISAAQYATQRAFDTRRGVTPSEDTPYVQYYELERFVRQQVNAILNLAKGPQTDRDAQRAMEQILDNPDNEKVVLSALRDLKRLYGQETGLSNQVVQDYEREFGRGSVAVPGSGGAAPSGIPQSEWDVMTPDERKLFSNPK